ncbi:hypothetical protein WA026_010131 [Henosepilachna vigintioctopunctata]|uniref:CUB domain-containing protein n=1 Tax=Henosepilachna vigintioctopunctata TaxID=420089 RepID=A0AAW1U9E5_9CUCU
MGIKNNLLFLIATTLIEFTYSKSDIAVSIPSTHTILSGDFQIRIESSSPTPLLVALSRIEGSTIEQLTNFSISPKQQTDYKSNVTYATIPCEYFSREGKYHILVKKKGQDSVPGSLVHKEITSSDVISQTVDVKRPMPQLKVTPEIIQTYPKQPVVATVEFPESMCQPTANCLEKELIDFQIELQYCGHSPSSCDIFSRQNNSLQILYAKQLLDFPGSQNISLDCKYFGLAGHYAVLLKSTHLNTWLLLKAAFIKADWSEEFVFNVHTQSIFPCDRHNGGITVLFQYPACIMLTGDRVRLFARHRANVAALAPPTTLEYVAEQKVLKGSNKLKFDCDLFSERFIEYCFVYVSQAITGAVADVRMDCVSTLPTREYKKGGWGPWSSWTPCSSTCLGGMRSRFRLCDSPQPRFGGKFCKGHAVETEKCGAEIGNIWECFDGNYNALDPALADTLTVKQEVGLYCRCGCVVHLGRENPKRVLATSSRSCPGRIFWQIQAEINNIIQFKIEWFDSSCGRQWLKIRDGMTLASNMLADLSNHMMSNTSIINSTGSTMLLEFFSDDSFSSDKRCGGGFLAFAKQLENIELASFQTYHRAGITPFRIFKLTAVHSTSIFFLSGMFIGMALLAAQYTFRYRKYHITYTDDQDSMTDPSISCPSLVSRRSSNATVFSEVFSFQHLPQSKMLLESSDKQTGLEQNNLSGSVKLNKHQAVGKSPKKISEDEKKFHQIENEEDRNDTISSPSDSNSNEERKNSIGDNECSSIAPEHQDNSGTNPTKGLYSASRRIISTAKIRNTIPKETKDKKNRAKLLAGPSGSDFSICGNEMDLELDYYDYNVRNAGAAPGSYLGMDPAFLIYIPPIYVSGEVSPSEKDGMIESPENDEILSEEQELEDDKDSSKEYQYQEKSKPTEDNNKLTDKDDYRKESKHKKENTIVDNQSINFESKLVRLHLQDLSGLNSNEKKFEEIPMVDSNILDEIKYADEEDDDRQ